VIVTGVGQRPVRRPLRTAPESTNSDDVLEPPSFLQD